MAKLGPGQRSPPALPDAEWALRQGPGRPRRVDLRQGLNGLFSLPRTGCQWRLLPRAFPSWGTVRYDFDTWTAAGMWVRLNDAWRERLRVQAGRHAPPSAAIRERQRVKTPEGGGVRGYDAPPKSQRPQAPGAGGDPGASAPGAGPRGGRVR